MRGLTALSAVVMVFICATSVAQAGYHRADAQKIAKAYGWTGAEWNALDEIIAGPFYHGKRSGGESGWESCARYPGIVDCGYRGTNSCGIPQRDPCPSEWQGHLDSTWRAQLFWLMNYIRGNSNFHDPIGALAFHRLHNYY